MHLLAYTKFLNTFCCRQFSGSSRMVYKNNLHYLRILRNNVIFSCLVGRHEPLHLSLPIHFWFRRQIPHPPKKFCDSNHWTLLCFLENLDTEETLEVERCTELSPPGIKHVMQLLPLGTSFPDKGNILDEVLLISKGGCFAFTVTALWFEADISHYLLQHQGMAPEAPFHQPQSLTSCVLLQRRTERKAPKAEEQILDFSGQYRAFFNNALAAPLKITGVGP